MGVHTDPDDLVGQLRQQRRSLDLGTQELDFEISIVRDIRQGEVRIYTDSGRISRPLFVVGDERTDDGHQLLKIKKRDIEKINETNESSGVEDGEQQVIPINCCTVYNILYLEYIF